MRKHIELSVLVLLLGSSGMSGSVWEPGPRAADLGVPFEGVHGPLNAITDVPGVEVGFATLISGTDTLEVGRGPVRTGVTVVLPKGKTQKGYATGSFIFNGDGEMTGLPYVQDYGRADGPIGLTNTNSVGVVRDAIGQWLHATFRNGRAIDFAFGLPIVAETWDGALNDINGFHVTKEDVFRAIDSAAGGPVAEGNVGGGTGMICYWFKGGTGTSSRVVEIGGERYVVGVLVQANFGARSDLMVAGVPVGKEITDLEPIEKQDGSVIVVIVTDAPLSSSQLNLVARRATLGIGRTGTIGSNGSGDLFLACSTAENEFDPILNIVTSRSLAKSSLDGIYRATVEATEEAVINAMVAAETMEGINGNTVFALPHDRLRDALKKYNRLPGE